MSNALKEFFAESGRTQTEIAQKMGVYQSTLSKWALGKSKVPVERVPQLSELTGIPRLALRPDKPELFDYQPPPASE